MVWHPIAAASIGCQAFGQSITWKGGMSNSGQFGRVYSGQIIGAIVKALDLERGILKERTARRFFAGQPVNEHNHTQIFLALGEALVDRGVVPVPPLFKQYDASISVFIGASIARAALKWDNLMAEIQSRSATTRNYQLATELFLRLGVVDLSLRVFALARLAGLDPHPPETPLWAEENGGGKLIRQFLHQAGMTRDQLAARLEASPTSVDNWLDGKVRPTPENITALAEVFATLGPGVDKGEIEHKLQSQFTFAHLGDLLEPIIGREKVVELSTALMRFAWAITEDVRTMDRPPLEEAAGVEIDTLRLGTDYPESHTLLRNLSLAEADESWKKDILKAIGNWELPFQEIASKTGLPRMAAGLAQDMEDLQVADPAYEAIKQLANQLEEAQYWLPVPNNDFAIFQHLEEGLRIFEIGIVRRRAITRDFPLSPAAHFNLGSFLGMVGKRMHFPDLIDEGITECKIAAGLLPEWDAPAVEPGIILINVGEYEKALEELHRAKEVLPDETPHLQINTGYALMKLSKHSEALEQFEKVIAVRPDYAMSYKFAAICAFSLGNKRKGLNYAKNARRLGEPGPYIAWKKGFFSTTPTPHPPQFPPKSR